MSGFNNLRKPLVVALTTALLTTAVGSPAFAQSDTSPSDNAVADSATDNSVAEDNTDGATEGIAERAADDSADVSEVDGASGFETQGTDGGVVLTGLGSVEVTDGQLHVPATIDGKPVVEIADDAFKGAGLKKVVFEDGVALKAIGKSAFQGNELEGDVELEVGVIGDNAFAQNKLKSVKLHNVTEVGNDAFRDNEVTDVSFMTEHDVELHDRAFANNRIKDTLDLKSVGNIGTEAFAANFIKRAQLGDSTRLGDNVFIDNKAWVVLEAEASDPDKGIVTTKYESGHGQVVNPVSIVVHYKDADGNTIHPDEVLGEISPDSEHVFEKGKEATLTPRQLSGYTLDTEKLTFTPDRDRFEVTAKYIKVPGPTLTIPGKYNLKNGEKPTDEFFRKGVTAKSGDDDLTSKVRIDFSAVDENNPGVYPVIFSVVDAAGNETVETANVSVGISYPDYEFGGGWQIKDFTYDGDKVTGFSDSGKKKLKSGKTELWIPPFNSEGDLVNSIRDYAFRLDARELTAIRDWGEVTTIGGNTFNYGNLTSIPDSWGKVTEIGYGAFQGNQLTSLPDSWGKITKINSGTFRGNQLTSLPDDWGEITELSEQAFYKNQLTSLPDNWGKMTTIGVNAFMFNNLTSLPDDWGEVSVIKSGAFARNQITSLPDNWGKVTSVSGFNDNQITSLPDDWGNVTSVSGFYNNQITSLPDDWGKVTSVEGFSNNEITSLPNDWGKVTSVSGFSNNEITSLPDSWGNIDYIGPNAFYKNQLTSLPDGWGKVASIGSSAFRDNQLTSLPDNWGNITGLDERVFYNNQLTSIPDSWGKITYIRSYAFYDNQLTSLPDDWGKMKWLGKGVFWRNQLPRNLTFTLSPENLTSRLVSDVDSSGVPTPVALITHDRTNPNNIESTDKVRINPVEVTYVFVDEEGNEIAPSLTETKSSDEKVVFKPPFLEHLGYKAVEPSIEYTVAREDTQTVKVVYSKSDVQEDTKTNISLDLNNDEPYPIGDSMTGKVRIDRTGHDTEPLVNPRVYFTLDPNVYDVNSVNITDTSLNIDKSTFKRDGNSFSFVVPALNPAQSLEVPFRVKFKKKVTPSKTEFPIVATLADSDGNIVRISEPESFEGYYKNPYQRVTANGEKKNGLVDNYEQTVVSNAGDNPDAYVADDREGERVKNTITYTIKNIDLDRNVGDYETVVYLPEYTVHEKSKLYDADNPRRLAKFDPALNPGWTLSDDGTYVTFKGTRNNTSFDFSDTLVLGYPGSVENERISLKSETTLVPFNKPNDEPVMLTSDTTTNHFARYVPPPGKIIVKYPTDNHGSHYSNYFYDNDLERHGKFGWIIPFNATHTFHDAVFTDFELDSRMYYDSVTIPVSLGKVEVRVLDDRGAVLDSQTVNGSKRTVTFEKNKVITAAKVEMQLIDHALVKGTSDTIYFTSKLKDPDTPIYGDEKQDTIFRNSAQLDTKEGSFGPVYAQKTVKEQVQEIAAFKTQQGYNTNGEKVDNLITDDNIRYTVGFTPREGFGETITNITTVDLLPLGVDVENVEMTPQFAQLPGATYEVVENYNGTGQTAVVFKASSATAQELNPGNQFAVAHITVKTSMLVEDGKITNDVYVQAQNTELANKVANPPAGSGEWSHADVWTNYTGGSNMSARKQIRTYDAEGKPLGWTSSVTTDPGALLDYKLRLDNGTENERGELVIYDVLPHTGDVGIPNKRESFFSNTYDPSRKPTLPKGYSIQYYNGDEYPTHPEGKDAQSEANKVLEGLNWEDTPSVNTKAVKITQDKGVTIDKRERVEFILPMKANAERLDEFGNPPADLVGPSAYNTFFWKDNRQPQLIEGNRVENKLRNKPASIELKKVDEKGKALAGARFELKTPEGDVVASAVSGDNGTVRFDTVNVEPGYTVSEVQAPKGYQVSDRVIKITPELIKKAYAQSPAVITLAKFANAPVPPAPTYGEVEFTKIDVKGNPLPGTKFELTNGEDSYVGVANKDGKVIIAGIKPGTYTLKETAPLGNLQPIKDVKNVKVEGNKTTYLGKTVKGKEHAIVNDKVAVDLTKLSVNDARLFGDNGLRPFGSYQLTDGSKLKGATFEVINDETNEVVSKVTSSDSESVKIADLKPHTVYRLNEIVVPADYEKVESLDLKFQVDEKGALLSADGTPFEIQSGLIVPNRAKAQDSIVTLSKVDYDGNPVVGAEFTLERKEGDRWVAAADPQVTGEDGVLSWTLNDTNTYRIVETKTPEGYKGGYVSPVFVALRDKAQTLKYTAKNAKVQPTVAKVEYIARGVTSREAAQEIADKNKGSVIEKKGTNYQVARYPEGAVLELRENDKNGKIVQTLTTGKDGKAKVTVPVDPAKTYVLVETEAPEGYERRSQEVSFKAETRLASGNENGQFTVYVPNYKKVGRITVSKLDAATGGPLTGKSATFEAVAVKPVTDKQDGDIEVNGTYYRPTGKTLSKKSSDTSGVAVFDNLEYGTYMVRESKAAKGYVLDTAPAIFEVNENDATHTFVLSNEPEKPGIKVTKYINGRDANSEVTAVWLKNDAETMDVKVVVENTGNTPLKKVTVNDIIKDVKDQYIDAELKNARFTVKDKDGNVLSEGQANGAIELAPADKAEVTLTVKSPEKGDMHRDDATATGYYGEEQVTDDDPAHSYRIPDMLKFILPATGVIPRVGIILLIITALLGAAWVVIRRKKA